MANFSPISFFKVSVLPASPLPNSFYFVLPSPSSPYAESYLTNASGQTKGFGNSAMINALITQQLQNYNGFEIVNTYAELNAFIATVERSVMILVLDASGDPSGTVLSGSVLYAYNESNMTVTKIAEYESLDISWDNLRNRPDRTKLEIEQAVDYRHQHTDLTALNKLTSDVDYGIIYDGSPIKASAVFIQNDW